MKNIYTLELIDDYISGNEIVGWDTNELENDSDFMYQVFVRSKDKNMYNLCSDRVKRDFLFVKKLIELFKADEVFVKIVANYYINSFDEEEQEENLSVKELIIIVNDLIDDFEFKFRAWMVFADERSRILICFLLKKQENSKIDFGNGFIFTMEKYANNPIILNFIAKRIIIMLFDDVNLEELVHSEFATISDFENYGEIRFLCDYIGKKYDHNLAKYVLSTLDNGSYEYIFKDFFSSLTRIKNHWDNYFKRLNEWRIDRFFYLVNKYICDTTYMGKLELNDVLYYVSKELKIEDLIKKYDSQYTECDEDTFSVLGIDDIKLLNNSISIMKGLLLCSKIDLSYGIPDEYVNAESSKKVEGQKTSKEEGNSSVIKFRRKL